MLAWLPTTLSVVWFAGASMVDRGVVFCPDVTAGIARRVTHWPSLRQKWLSKALGYRAARGRSGVTPAYIKQAKQLERLYMAKTELSGSQYKKYAKAQAAFDGGGGGGSSLAGGSENEVPTSGGGGTAKGATTPKPKPKRVTAGHGTPEQRQACTHYNNESIALFDKLLVESPNVPKVRIARKVMGDLSNAHSEELKSKNVVLMSPKTLVQKHRLGARPEVDPKPPVMGRKRVLPATVEAKLVGLALGAADAGGAFNAAQLATASTAVLGSAQEGLAILERFKHNRLTKKNVRDIVKRADQLVLEPVEPLAGARAKATRWENYVEHYAHFEKMIIRQELGVKSNHYNPSQPLSESILITKPQHIVGADESAMCLGDSESRRTVDKFKVVRKLRYEQDFLEANAPVDGSTVEEHAVHVAALIRVKRRQKALSSKAEHITFVAGHTFDGQLLPIMVIFQSDRDAPHPDWLPTEADMDLHFTMNVNNHRVQSLFRTSPSGGMTRALWREYSCKIVVPCIGRDVYGKPHPGIFMFDGDQNHMDAQTWEALKEAGIESIVPPAGLTQDLQVLDAGESFSTWATTHLPNAKELVRQELLSLRVDRDLMYGDVRRFLTCVKASFPRTSMTKGVAICGYNPFNRQVLERPDIKMLQPSQGKAPLPKQLDLDKICFYYDQELAYQDPKYAILWADDSDPEVAARMDAAAAELYRQIGGGRCTSSAFWTHALGDRKMTLVAKIYERAVLKRKLLKADRCAFVCLFVYPPPPSCPSPIPQGACRPTSYRRGAAQARAE